MAAYGRDVRDFAGQDYQAAVIPPKARVLLARCDQRGYGLADIAAGTPATPQTVFPLNSITKAFTGVAALREVEAGRLDLSAPIGGYVGDLPPAWRGVSIARLLSHTSGLPNFVDNNAGGRTDEAAAWKETLAKPLHAAITPSHFTF